MQRKQRQRNYLARDIELLQLAHNQRVTGYKQSERETIRLLDGTIVTRQFIAYEARNLVTINRSNPSRFEIALTFEGRKLALKYRAQPFIY